MKLTKTALKRLIREEVSKELSGDPLEDLIQQSYEKEDDALAVQRRQMFDVLGDKSASPDKKRRTINKALKDGLFGDPKSPEAKKEWRRLRRKHHRRQKRPSRKELEYPDQGGGKLAAGGVKKAREQGRTAVVMSDKNKPEVAGIKKLDREITRAYKYINDAVASGNKHLEMVVRKRLKQMQREKKALVRKANSK